MTENRGRWTLKQSGLLAVFHFTAIVLMASASFATEPGKAPAPPQAAPPSVAAQALAGPMRAIEDVVFAVRLGYDDPHWYANIGYYCDDENHKAYAGNGKPDTGKLCRLNLRSGKTTVLVDAAGGSIRDPQVHYDAQKILFSYRLAGSDFYKLYEVNVDGTGLRPITTGDYDDYEPTYLPDGGILFVSTRCRSWVNCWMTQVGVLYRCDADGKNVRRLSYSGEHDNTPWVLPDGRILYTRWEYVDRSQVEFHHLWAMNPDGSRQTVFYGNMHPGVVMIDAKPIPGSDRILASFSPGHGASDHRGIATIVSPAAGPDQQASARALHGGPLVMDPYPISDDCFLMVTGNDCRQIAVMNGAGKSETLYTLQGPGRIHEPRPLLPRPRERVIPAQSDPSVASGHLMLSDVYQGRNMQGVRRGDIKKLLILESLPKQVNFSGGPDLVSWLGTFTLERVLGTVPVEDDGSAYFEVPAGRPVFFVALDDKEMSVKRMHSFTSVAPGEVNSCLGCHESRTTTPPPRISGEPKALSRRPSRIEPFAGLPDVLDFPRDIQPILDRHCVRCHDLTKPEGHLVLSGDLGPTWSLSFFNLFAHRQIGDGRNGLGNSPPRSVGSSASPLLKTLDPSHYEVHVTPQEWRTVWLWIESGAPYAGSYAGLRNAQQQAITHETIVGVFQDASEVLTRRCQSCHVINKPTSEEGRPLPFRPATWPSGARRNIGRPVGVFERVVLENDPVARYGDNVLLNFSRPALSPLVLGPLAKQAGGWGSCGEVFKDSSDADYQRLVAVIQKGKDHLDTLPRYATAAFKPNRQYVREMKRFGILPASFDVAKDPIDVFAIDQAYWRSLWPRPDAEK